MTLSVATRSELSECSDEKSLIEFVSHERAELRNRWSPENGGRAWVQEHAALMDAVVRRLFALAIERTGGNPDVSSGALGIAVIATGGYGQRMLAPASDLDLTVVAGRDEDPPVLRSFFSLVMDVLMSGNRIKVGYAFRTPADAESGTLDHHTQTALLDARYIVGDGSLFARFDRLFHENLQTAAFLFLKEREREERHRKYGLSPYVAEPEIKNGAGGLRDLQTAYWMARVRFHRMGEGLWRDLVRRKVMTREDYQELLTAREFFWSVRCALHLAAGERKEILSRPRQEEVAQRLGIEDVEVFLQRYYAAAEHIARISDKVVARCMDTPLPLGDTGLSAVRRRVAITEPAKTETDSLWPLKALDYCQAHGLEFALATDEAVERFLASKQWQEADVQRAAGRAFLALLTKPGDVGATLRRMRWNGLLTALLPELAACMGLVPSDPSHIHTVGEHSLCVLDNIIRLRDEVRDDDARLGSYRAAFKSLDAPLPLLLAALLHDLGKQWSTFLSGERGRHEETGAERIPAICDRLGCTPDVRDTTLFLVRQHLLLAETSRLRDLGRVETIREVARAVGDQERLRMLYILTYADTSAVGPGVFSEMNARLLEELFLRVDDMFSRATHAEPPPDAGVRDDRLESVRERLRRRLVRDKISPSGISPETIREHIEAMPAAYLLNTPLETMALHLAMVDRLRGGDPVVVDMQNISGSNLTELTVVTHDDPTPGLLSKITGALLACDVDIHTAQVFTRDATRGELVAIDTLRVDYKGHALVRDKREAVEDALRSVLRGEATVADLLARRRRPFSMEQPIRSYRVENAPNAEYTLMDVEAPDETGVVYRLATLFTGFGWNIHAARVSAWAGNARAAFYLTDRAGNPLEVATVDMAMQSLHPENG